MTTPIRHQLPPAAASVAAMLRGLGPQDLDRPTPCQEWRLGDLARHAVGTTTGLARIGRRLQLGPDPWAGRDVDATDWNTVLADNVEDVAAAWRDDAAWSGSVELGAELPATTIGEMAYAEILLHGWDIARSVGVELEVTAPMAAALRANIEETGELGRQLEAYGPQVEVAGDADDLEQALAGSGRDPRWRLTGR
jgi:uncharacterized protein (TIGR03086 family)